MRPMWSRRDFLTRMGKAGAGLTAIAGAGYGGYRWPRDAASGPSTAATPAPDVERFRTRADLSPPNVTTSRQHAGRVHLPQLFFIAPKGYDGTGPGTQGPLIVDHLGQVVWFEPSPGRQNVPEDLQVQRYKGKPVLTWWRGTSSDGHGQGAGIIMDSSYRTIATVKAGNGRVADLHEFRLTDRGTALISAYRQTTADLSPIGGNKRNAIYSGLVQEIDIESGAVLFEWDSIDHVGIEETYKRATAKEDDALDYFHINSIDVDSDGDLLVSGRNTWTVYKISRTNGKIRWRLGGKNSDFAVDANARFQWQHDVRARAGNRISMFDNGSSPQEAPQSRGLLLQLDEQSHEVIQVRDYTHPARLLADNQGSMQILDNGQVCIGWGAQPYFSVFSSDATLLLDGRLPANEQSYRALTYDWSGRPDSDPDISLGSNPAGGATVYASWNGATEVAGWRVLAGKGADSLQPVARSSRSGFETAIAVRAGGPAYAVAAVDRAGTEIGRSAVVKA